MSEVCAILKAKPWVDKSKPKPAPEKIHEVVLPEREEKETDHSYMVKVKAHVLKEVEGLKGVRIRATPSKVAPGSEMKAEFVAYVEPQIEKPKRFPVSRSGVAASSLKR